MFSSWCYCTNNPALCVILCPRHSAPHVKTRTGPEHCKSHICQGYRRGEDKCLWFLDSPFPASLCIMNPCHGESSERVATEARCSLGRWSCLGPSWVIGWIAWQFEVCWFIRTAREPSCQLARACQIATPKLIIADFQIPLLEINLKSISHKENALSNLGFSKKWWNGLLSNRRDDTPAFSHVCHLSHGVISDFLGLGSLTSWLPEF